MSDTSSCRIEISSLVKCYPGGVTAVDHVDLAVEKGEVLALLGPSGCGKTTLLQSITGFVSPDEGDISLDGESILGTPPERRRTAMMFQHYALFPHMTVRENVGYGLRMARVPKVDLAERVKRAMDMVQISQFGDRRPSQLSGGQRQRVALARAVVTNPRALLLDEPLGALDQNLREEMQVELAKLQRRLGITTMMVTHDQHEAIVLADRIAVMQNGCIEQISNACDLYDRPRNRFVASFMGMDNFLPAEDLGNGTVRVMGETISGVTSMAAHGKGKTLCLRGEFINLKSIAPKDRTSGLGGKIAFAQMLGANMRYEVEMADESRLVVIQSRINQQLLQVGSDVQLDFASERCILLED
jgi:ABC-type Fe3+/spermidine/putrescine transport system ATPase subunit